MRNTIIDTHMHLWNLPGGSYPWYTDTSNTNLPTQGFDEVPQLEDAGVNAVIVVQSANTIDDTDYMLEQAARYPWIVGVVGWLPLEDPEATGKALELYTQNPYFRGVRHLIHKESNPHWMLQDNVMASLGLLAEKDLPFEVYGSYADHLLSALFLGNKLPELKLIIDHLGNPQIDGHFSRTWKDNINRASDNPNIYMKISGLITNVADLEHWTINDLRPYIEYVLASFGTERCFCGSDWPMSLQAASYADTIEIYRKVMEFFLTPADQQKVFRTNPEQCYRIQYSTQATTA
jgi:L-fuconolactonase